MKPLVFTFRKVRLSAEDARECFAEIERGRAYYNRMIDRLNELVQRELPTIEKLSANPRFLAESSVIYPWLDMPLSQQHLCDVAPNLKEDDLKARQCAVIYPLIRHCAIQVRAEIKPSSSGCSKYMYDMVSADFDRAVSSKRKNTWPGERYKRRHPGGGGESVGVRFSGTEWGRLKSGSSSIFVPISATERYGSFRLKVSREHTIEAKVAWQSHGRKPRVIPDDATISRVYLDLVGDYSQAYVDNSGSPRGKWYLRVECQVPDEFRALGGPRKLPVGIDVGWSVDGDMLCAITSEGDELRVPRYALGYYDSANEVRSTRDQLRNAVIEYTDLPEAAKQRISAAGLASYIQRKGLDVRADVDPVKQELFVRFIEQEEQLRRKAAHLVRRPLNIRDEHYRKFIQWLGNRDVFIEHLAIKSLAEDKHEKGDQGATARVMAAPHVLLQLLRNRGAEEVEALPDDRERLGDERLPTKKRAAKILSYGLAGKRHQRAARKATRKFRKRKESTDTPHDATRMAS